MSKESLSRRKFLTRAGTVSVAAIVPAAAVDAIAAPGKGGRAPHPATPKAALHLLQGGNKRYRANKLQLRDYSPVGERRAKDQKPFAAILTCSDSRISPTLIFDVERGNCSWPASQHNPRRHLGQRQQPGHGLATDRRSRDPRTYVVPAIYSPNGRCGWWRHPCRRAAEARLPRSGQRRRAQRPGRRRHRRAPRRARDPCERGARQAPWAACGHQQPCDRRNGQTDEHSRTMEVIDPRRPDTASPSG